MSYQRGYQRGYQAEHAFEVWLRAHGWPHAERRPLGRHEDRGDIQGTPGICWEVRWRRTLRLVPWLAVIEAKARQAGCDLAVLVVKPERVNLQHAGDWAAVVRRSVLDKLTAAAAVPVELQLAPMPARPIPRWTSTLPPGLDPLYGYELLPRYGILPDRPVVVRVDDIGVLLRRAGYGSPIEEVPG